MADAPITNLEVVQRGVESAAGTLVAATHRVNIEPGSVKLGNGLDLIRRRYSGSAATGHSVSPGLSHVALGWDERASYDYLAVVLQATLAPTTTGTGGGNDKSWAFLPSDTAPDGLKRHSLELGGKDTWPESEHLAGCVVESLEITWNKSDDWMLAINYIGTKGTQAALTGALGMPSTLVPILGKLTKVWIDAATFGSTALGTAIKGKIAIKNVLSERFLSDGNDYPARIVVTGRQVSASLDVEYNAAAIRTAWRAQTLQKVRIGNQGPVLGGSFYSATFDIPGEWSAVQLGDDDGIITLGLDLVAEFNATLTADISATIVNSIAAVP